VKADAHRVDGRFSGTRLVKLVLFDRTFGPVFTLRLCQWTQEWRQPWRLLGHGFARLWHRGTQAKAGLDLPWRTNIGPGLRICHGWGLVINVQARIGRNVTLFHGVTLGQKDVITDGHRSTSFPVLADDVCCGPYALIIGDVTVGKGAIIAPATVVTKPVAPACLVGGNPMRVIRENVFPDVENPAPLDDCR
jgi:serine O-acetyltransferase